MTILIKNAQLIDGTGSPPVKGDIFIRNGTISAIGNLSRQSADKVIQAAGLYAAPGFIDLHTVSDHYLTIFTDPEQGDFLRQGVTTVIAGHCGASLAPLLYGGLESIRKWGDTREVNVDWHTVAEFLGAVERLRLGVNFGTLIGHSTIRRALIGEALRDLSLGELSVFEKILKDGLEQGALGFSTGLGYVHGRGTPYSEIEDLIKIVERKGGIYTTHLRDENAKLVDSIAETIKVTNSTGVTTVVSHFRPLKGFENEYTEALELFDATKNLYFDIFPFDTSIVQIYSLLPRWAQTGALEVMLENIKNPSLRKRMITDIDISDEDATIISTGTNAYLAGKTLKGFAKDRGVPIKEALLQLMELVGLRATIAYKNVDYPLTVKTLGNARSLISASSTSLPPHASRTERSETFTRFLHLSQKEKMMPIEAAVKKITSTPAAVAHLLDRGVLKSGAPADVTLFSLEVGSGAQVQHVFVNGVQAIEQKKSLASRSGKILTKK